MLRDQADRIWLASPTMHGEELAYVKEAYDTNWMSTVGANIDAIEKQAAKLVGCEHAVALSSGTAALHLAVRLAGVKAGDEVLCSDLTFSASVNPVLYEGGTPIFVDSEYETWNMDPVALEKAFSLHPRAKVVVVAHLYGTPAKIDEIRTIAERHGALIIEDAAESLGATYRGLQTGQFGTFGCISFNGNKIITGSSGGMLLCDDELSAFKARKWSTQARENAPWYQHEEIGYNYRMSNVIAGVVRGQLPYLDEHIEKKREIYTRYKDGFANIPVEMNPFEAEMSKPNYWLSCITIRPDAMGREVRGERDVLYCSKLGESTPHEILDALARIGAEGRPIWKPMHLQPIFRNNAFITQAGNGRAMTNAYSNAPVRYAVDEDIFNRGLCLPSDIKMTQQQQKRVIDAVCACFD